MPDKVNISGRKVSRNESQVIQQSCPFEPEGVVVLSLITGHQGEERCFCRLFQWFASRKKWG